MVSDVAVCARVATDIALNVKVAIDVGVISVGVATDVAVRIR